MYLYLIRLRKSENVNKVIFQLLNLSRNVFFLFSIFLFRPTIPKFTT